MGALTGWINTDSTRTFITRTCFFAAIHIVVISYLTWNYNEDKIKFEPLKYYSHYSHYLNELEKCTPNAYSTPNEEVCSHQIFQSYFKICKKLPEYGNWTRLMEYKHGRASFSTPLCRVQNVRGQTLAKQLQITHTKRIVMVGDSHGFRYFTALKNLVVSSGYDCRLIRQEEGEQDGPKHMLYYLARTWGISEKSLTREKRSCLSCRCTLLQCKHNTTRHAIELEFLGMILSSNFILPNRTFCLKANYTFCEAKSEKELIFKHYLAYRTPDVVIVATTSSHDLRKLKVNGPQVKVHQILPHYKALKSLVDSLHPKLTMWITTNFQRRYGYMNEEVHAFNQALFKLLEKDLTGALKSPLTVIGFDHTALSRPLSPIKWSNDRIHYHPQFYMEVMNQLMNQFCTIHPAIMASNNSVHTSLV